MRRHLRQLDGSVKLHAVGESIALLLHEIVVLASIRRPCCQRHEQLTSVGEQLQLQSIVGRQGVGLVGRLIQLGELLFRSGAKKQILVHCAPRTKDRDEKDKTDSPHEAEGTAIFAAC